MLIERFDSLNESSEHSRSEFEHQIAQLESMICHQRALSLQESAEQGELLGRLSDELHRAVFGDASRTSEFEQSLPATLPVESLPVGIGDCRPGVAIKERHLSAIRDLTSRIEAMKVELCNANASNAILTDNLSSVQAESSSLRSELSEMMAFKDALRDANCALQAQLDSLGSQHLLLQEELSNANSTTQHLSSDVDSLQQTLRLANDRHAAQLCQLAEEKEKNKTELAALQSAFDELQMAKNILSEKYSVLDAVRSALVKTKASLDERCTSLSTELSNSQQLFESTKSDFAKERQSLTTEIISLREASCNDDHEREIAALQAQIEELTNFQFKLQRNLKFSRKENQKAETRILHLLRMASPQVMDSIPANVGLVNTVHSFLMKFPIILLAKATQKIGAIFAQVGRSVEEMNAKFAQLQPRTNCITAVFTQYESRTAALSAIIDRSLTFESLAATLHKLLGTEAAESGDVDQHYVQALLEQVRKRIHDNAQRGKIGAPSKAPLTKRTPTARRQ
jgi:predicted  nucleic acid-binding Zn-ribbon protein